MKISLMRVMDRYLGKAIICVLAVLQWLAGCLAWRRRKGGRTDGVSTILVQKYFGLGSIMNSLPLLRVLRTHYPEARIVYLTFESNREFLEITGGTDEILTLRSSSLPGFARDLASVLVRLRRMKVDACIDLEFFSRFSMIVSVLSGAPRRVGFFSYFNIRSALLTHPTALNHYKHISRAFLSMAEVLGCEVPEDGYRVALPSQDSETQRRVREIIGNPQGRPVVTVNPNASTLCIMRRWPAENFVRLLQRLLVDYPGHHFVLIGSGSEFDYVEFIRSQCPATDGRLVNVAGKTNLRQLLALLEGSDLVVSNDSGPVHLAAGYATPTIVFFGPETPVLYKPLNDNVRVFYRDCYCSPCINVLDNKSFEECSEVRCMVGISPDDVHSAAVEMLADRPVGAARG